MAIGADLGHEYSEPPIPEKPTWMQFGEELEALDNMDIPCSDCSDLRDRLLIILQRISRRIF